ncbi:MAG TPA: dihydrofolate reductase family protein, partial [Actinomycetota bacterium]|nr:dihydrofolate reductase family protein [Actinomycetota bacterium]
TGWKEKGAEVLVLDGTGAGVGLSSLVDALGRRGLLEVYCEGGGAVATSLLRGDLVGRLELYYGGVIAGRGGPEIGDLGTSSLGEASRWTTQNVERVGDDLFTEMHSPALTGLLEAHQTEEIVETISQTNEVVSTIRKTNKAG